MAKTLFSDTPPLGTIVTAAFLNLLNNHRHAGTNTDGDGALDYAVATGSANAYAIALAPVLTANSQGMPVRFKANFTNTGAATLAINGMAPIALKKNINVALVAGDIQSGQIYTACFDGTNYQLLEIAPRMASICVATRDVSLASGNMSYTGAGFKPSIVATLSITQIPAQSGGCVHIGFNNFGGRIEHLSIGDYYDFTTLNASANLGAGLYQDATIASYDPDGHTLTWIKTGNPTGIMYLMFLYIR